MLNVRLKHCQCLEGRVEPAGVSGEEHRDGMEQGPRATSPRGLRRLCGQGDDRHCPQLRPRGEGAQHRAHAAQCELGQRRMKEIILPKWKVWFSGQCLAVMALAKMVQLIPRNLYMGWVAPECESKKELSSEVDPKHRCIYRWTQNKDQMDDSKKGGVGSPYG